MQGCHLCQYAAHETSKTSKTSRMILALVSLVSQVVLPKGPLDDMEVRLRIFMNDATTELLPIHMSVRPGVETSKTSETSRLFPSLVSLAFHQYS